MSIGGIQTYIKKLCGVIRSIGFAVRVFQCSNKPFDIIVDDVEIIGLCIDKKKLSRTALQSIPKEELVIFANENLIVPTEHHTIAIQHGIAWDKPSHVSSSSLTNRLMIIKRAFQAYRRVKLIEKINVLVCVDYNFINWYRTQVGYTHKNICVIPNFTYIPYKGIDNKKPFSIIFARRLYEYRGTRIFVNAIEKLLKDFSDLDVTIAGSGPDEQYIRERLAKYSSVSFIKYNSEDSIKIHSDKLIAVVPTLGSEGTSLSLLEAMASKCAVICTNVGGMTNIVIDGYNGQIIMPDENELYYAILKYLNDDKYRSFVADNGYKTVANSFSYEKWEERWTQLLQKEISNYQ